MVKQILDILPQKDINIIDKSGNSPLLLAVKMNFRKVDYYNIIKYLIEKGIIL
jgi:ankyrin repeat protein